MPTPKTDGKLNSFLNELSGLISTADSDSKVKLSDKTSADAVQGQRESGYTLALATAIKYALLSKGIAAANAEGQPVDYQGFAAAEFEQYLNDALAGMTALETQNQAVQASLDTAIASIKDAANNLQTLTKNACDLRSTSSLENSLFDIAAVITQASQAIAAEAAHAGEYAEFAFNAAVKTAGIHALIGLTNLRAILTDIQTDFGNLKTDVDGNLATANTALQQAEATLLSANVDQITKTHTNTVAGHFEDGLDNVDNHVQNQDRVDALEFLRQKIDSLKIDAQSVFSNNALRILQIGDINMSEGESIAEPLPVRNPGEAPLTFTANTLPGGLSIDSDGVITGKLADDAGQVNNGNYDVEVKVGDGQANESSVNFRFIAKALNLSINPIGNQENKRTESIAPLTVTVFNPAGKKLTYSAQGLPPGLSIGQTTGVISGTPTTAGTFSTVVTVSDDSTPAESSTVSFTWEIKILEVKIKPIADREDQKDKEIKPLPVTVSNPAGRTFNFSANDLPDGLSIDPNTGIISGTPTGTFPKQRTFDPKITVSVAGNPSESGEASFKWVIKA
ncbi:MAG: putative Ig domain-containing protein [Lewinellaceae bacterium]|nr:putative Ig domain-containing protein [Lewinellaceae bacterium]